jgi:hypothetical protein
MADFTPWQIAARKAPRATTTYVVAYDPYNFSHITTTNGTNPPLTIPCDGPGAAGAVPPTSRPEIVAIEITLSGTNQPTYGSNLGEPRH